MYRENHIRPDGNSIALALAVSRLIKQGGSTDMLCNRKGSQPVGTCEDGVTTTQKLKLYQGGSCRWPPPASSRGRVETSALKGAAALTGADVTCLSNDLLLSLL